MKSIPQESLQNSLLEYTGWSCEGPAANKNPVYTGFQTDHHQQSLDKEASEVEISSFSRYFSYLASFKVRKLWILEI